jgi:hypothetical protein
MSGCISEWRNGDRVREAGEKKVPASSFTTYKIGEPYAPFGVTWTELQGENRPIWCFHLLFHPWFHLAATAKYPKCSQLACGSAAFGDGWGDRKWAVATPLFDGQCRLRTLRVARGFASLQGRHRPFPSPDC